MHVSIVCVMVRIHIFSVEEDMLLDHAKAFIHYTVLYNRSFLHKSRDCHCTITFK